MKSFKDNHWTIQQLTSQLQQMQESGNFQEVESNYCGRWSHVSSQLATLPSSRSMVSRDKRMPPDTWNTSGFYRKMFLEIIFQRLIHPEIIIEFI